MPRITRNEYKLKEVYRHYKKLSKDPVDLKTFKKVSDVWGKVVCNYLLEGRDVQLYSGLALLGVRKKSQMKYFSHMASKELDRPVYRTNVHSDGYVAKIYWNTHGVAYKRTGWSFRTSRYLARELSKIMLTPRGHTRYLKLAEAHGSMAYEKYKEKMIKL